MKLSEAILLGSTLGPQIFGDGFDKATMGTCANGAARLAMGHATDHISIVEIWPWLLCPADCPVCGAIFDDTTAMIAMHLNDKHRWSRERIADWVATIEPATETTEVSGQGTQNVQATASENVEKAHV